MYPHRIRLRGPWECEPLARLVRDAGGCREMRTDSLPPPCRMTLPCRWNEGGWTAFAGRARLRRRFGYPRQVDPHERLWLTFAGAETLAEVWLNGQFLGRHEGPEAFEFEVTSLLHERNQLTVEVEASTENGGLWGEVALEVRCPAFLRAVRCWAAFAADAVDLHVAGEVVGSSEGPLELYVLLDNATVLYTTLAAASAGQPFHVVAESAAHADHGQAAGDGSARPHEVRVELVKGAIVWYAVERTIEFGERNACP
jgi:hypothetical protein